MPRNHPKNWYVFSITTNPLIYEAMSNFLFEMGCAGIEEREHILNAFFPDSFSRTELDEKIAHYLSELRAMDLPVSDDAIKIQKLCDQDWNAAWKKNWQPIRMGDSLMVIASWLLPPPDAPKHVIEIDPEMAFGTGTHATTILTLQCVERMARGRRVLDIGTGTGILGIAAVKCGAKHVVALDIDPIATLTALKNANKNHVAEQMSFYTGTLSALRTTPFDLIVANVNRTEILKLLPQLGQLLQKTGGVILSGILVEEQSVIERALQRCGFAIRQITQMEGWIALVADLTDGQRDV